MREAEGYFRIMYTVQTKLNVNIILKGTNHEMITPSPFNPHLY